MHLFSQDKKKEVEESMWKCGKVKWAFWKVDKWVLKNWCEDLLKQKKKGIKRKKNSFPEGNKPKRSVGLKE